MGETQPKAKAHTAGPALRFVAAALIVRDGEVLIGQRRADQPMASLWEFPGRQNRAGRKPARGAGPRIERGAWHRSSIGPPVTRIRHHYRRGGAVDLQFFAVREFSRRNRQPDLPAGALGQADRSDDLRFPCRGPWADPGSGGGETAVKQLKGQVSFDGRLQIKRVTHESAGSFELKAKSFLLVAGDHSPEHHHCHADDDDAGAPRNARSRGASSCTCP